MIEFGANCHQNPGGHHGHPPQVATVAIHCPYAVTNNYTCCHRHRHRHRTSPRG